jgi:hypothetical protein
MKESREYKIFVFKSGNLTGPARIIEVSATSLQAKAALSNILDKEPLYRSGFVYEVPTGLKTMSIKTDPIPLCDLHLPPLPKTLAQIR